MEPFVWEKSVRDSIIQSIIFLVVVALVATAFCVVPFIIEDTPLIMWIAAGFVLLIGVVMAKKLLTDIAIYRSAETGWRVMIDDHILRWESPSEQIMRSFELRLADINRAMSIKIRSNKPGQPSRWRHYIQLRDGDAIEIDHQRSGFHVPVIFDEMKMRGVPVQTESVMFRNLGKLKSQLNLA